MGWSSYELPKLDSSVTTAVSSYKTISSTATTGMETVKGLLKALSLLEVPNLSPDQIAINTAIDAVKGALESLLKSAGVYALFVPARKRVIIPPQVKEALARAGLTDLPTPPMPFTMVNTPKLTTAGNGGFVRTVLESLEDKGDANRPMMGKDDAVAGMYIVAGAKDYVDLLSFVDTFNGLFAAGRPAASIDIPGGFPVPQSVKGRVGAGGVMLDWDRVSELVETPTLGLSSMIKKCAVIRSKSPALLSKTSVTEIFGKTELSAGDKVGTGDEEIEVLAILDDPTQRTYTDTTELDPKTPFYYAVSYGINTGSSKDLMDGGGDWKGYLGVSNIIKAVTAPSQSPARSSRGAPPDWIRTPGVIPLIPDLDALLKKLSVAVASFGGLTSGFGDMLKATVTGLEEEIKAYEDQVSGISGTVDKLTAVLGKSPTVGMYMRPFSGTGGKAFLAKDLVEAFTGTDPLKPPFDQGDEFVAGLVILTSGPSEASIESVKNALNALLLNAGPVSVIKDALANIDVVLSALEDQLLGDDFKPGAVLGVSPEESAGNACNKKPEATVTFADNMKVER